MGIVYGVVSLIGGIGGYEYGVPLHVRLSLRPTAPTRRVTLKRILDSEMGDLSCQIILPHITPPTGRAPDELAYGIDGGHSRPDRRGELYW